MHGRATWYGVGLLNPNRAQSADDSLSLVGSNPTPGAKTSYSLQSLAQLSVVLLVLLQNSLISRSKLDMIGIFTPSSRPVFRRS